jgi:PAS domain S-box-containing protein
LFGALNTAARQQSGSTELATQLVQILRTHLPALTSAAIYIQDNTQQGAAPGLPTWQCMGQAGAGAALNLIDTHQDDLQAALTSGTPATEAVAEETRCLLPFATSSGDLTHVLATAWPSADADPTLPDTLQAAVQIIGLALPRTSILEVLTVAQAEVYTERNLMRTLINNVPDYVFVKDRQSRFELSNIAHAHDVLGTTPDNALGKTDFDFFPQELAQQYYADEQALMESNQPLINNERASQAPDGTQTWHLNTKVPLHDTDGNVIGLVGIARDITAQKQAEFEREMLLQAEREQHELAETLMEISVSLTAQTNLDKLLDDVVAFEHRLLPNISTSGIARVENNALHIMRWEHIQHQDQEALFADIMNTPLPLDRLPALKDALSAQQPLIVDDVTTDAQWGRLQDYEWLRAQLFVPVVFLERVIGVLWVGSSTPGAFSNTDTTVLIPLANAAAVALENSRLLQESQTRATYEERLNQITVRLQENTNINSLLSVTLQDLGETLGARVGRVRLNSGGTPSTNGQATTEPTEESQA